MLADHEVMSRFAAQVVLAAVRRLAAESDGLPLRLVFSAGKTPIRLYELLATDYVDEFDWSRVHLYQMDEYVDPPSMDQDFSRYLSDKVIEPLGIGSANLMIRSHVDGRGGDWKSFIQRHEHHLRRSGGIDLVLHGIGSNGHLGFNEPGTAPTAAGAVVPLTASTRAAAGPIPIATHGVTLGLGVLLAAKETIVLASGSHKAQAVAQFLCGPVTSDCPASWLRCCDRVTVAVDAAAAKLL
ncbi:6-phosphogluconolactonase [Streptomyces sp. NPDC006640]|uniref:6-phosphogluconolactonase n=1 Tax=unclassified Streptomyces TaxID=2593676 RepID=UPI003693B9D6